MPMEIRIREILNVLKSTNELMHPKEIVKAYIGDDYNNSDVLTTQHYLNVLSCVGFVIRSTRYQGKSPRHTYRLSTSLAVESMQIQLKVWP